jgi:hypothetical protein
MEPTAQPPLLLRIARRIGIGVVGWLYALPFVLAGPVIFWLIAADRKELSLTGILWLAWGHAAVFLIVGLPLFLVFWGKRSLIWYLPNSLLLGFLLGAGAGFPLYYSSPQFYDRMFFLCSGYGIATAFGCWLANWICEMRARKIGKACLSLAFLIMPVLTADLVTG